MSDPTIVVTRRWPAAVEDRLRAKFPGTRFNLDDRPFTRADLHAALREAEIVLTTVSDRLDTGLFAGALRCRFLGNFGVGFDNIDVAAAAGHGIVVTNTPGVLTNTTADTAMTLMLMIARRAGEGEREVRAGRWTGWRPTHMMGADVTGKTLGILGMGRIGQAVARRAHLGFEMPVVYYDTFDPGAGAPPGAQRRASIEDVLAEADFVSLHMPGGGDNLRLIDARRLGLMKPSAFLVNTARGDVIDQPALIDALRNRTIAGAGLDVYPGEPEMPAEMRELENVVLLPHLGSATLETRTAMGHTVIDNLEAFLAGREPACRVA
jgi:lactate dehydrogenase-like 2-hydroxyacid dehydrogenase